MNRVRFEVGAASTVTSVGRICSLKLTMDKATSDVSQHATTMCAAIVAYPAVELIKTQKISS